MEQFGSMLMFWSFYCFVFLMDKRGRREFGPFCSSWWCFYLWYKVHLYQKTGFEKTAFLSPVVVSIFKEVSKQLWKFLIFSSWTHVKLDKICNVRRYNQWISYDIESLLCPEGLLHFFSVTMFIQQRRNPFLKNYPNQDLIWISPMAPCSLNSKLLCSEVSIRLSWRP